MNEIKTNDTGRYSVGQVIYAVAFLKDGKPSRLGWGRNNVINHPEMPSDDIKIVKLVVTEHHKVASVFDPDEAKVYDGYLLKDENVNIWVNQWPNANYGQLDDSANRFFARHIKTTDEYETITALKQIYATTLLTDVYGGIAAFAENRDEYKPLLKTIEEKVKQDYNLVFKKQILVDEYPDIYQFVLVEAD